MIESINNKFIKIENTDDNVKDDSDDFDDSDWFVIPEIEYLNKKLNFYVKNFIIYILLIKYIMIYFIICLLYRIINHYKNKKIKSKLTDIDNTN